MREDVLGPWPIFQDSCRSHNNVEALAVAAAFARTGGIHGGPIAISMSHVVYFNARCLPSVLAEPQVK